LGEALKVNMSLTGLDLSNNNVGDEGAAVLLKALMGYNTTLTTLDLYLNTISRTIWSTIKAFVAANESGTRLLHAGGKLDLSSKRIDNVQAKRVAMELADNTNVTTLLLNQNKIHCQGCLDIAHALNKNRVLTSVELDYNSIGRYGCWKIATMISENTVLMKVSLNRNRIGPAGAIALAETLRINTSLRKLGLGGNNIGNKGAAAITDALRFNLTLQRLDLSSNRIRDDGALAILKALKESSRSLALLNLKGNTKISSGLQKDIGFMLASRRALKSFCKRLCKPLEKRMMPMAIQVVQESSVFCKKLECVHCQETTAGPIFLLVRALALNDSKVVNVTAL
jgi:Leucine Rich repeat